MLRSQPSTTQPGAADSGVGSINEFDAIPCERHPSVILLVICDRTASDPSYQAELQDLASRHGGVPVIVVADGEGPADILAALDGGAQGYIPTSASMKVLAEAIGLPRSGDSFVPASCIFGLK